MKKASEIMTKKLVTIQRDTKLLQAYQLMQERKIRHLPVTGDDAAIVGLLSDRDLQRAMRPKSGKVSAVDEIDFEFDPESTVSDYMTWPVRIVASDCSVRDVALIMLNEKISAVLVSNPNAKDPRGIVTTDDMLRLLVQLLEKDPSKLKLGLGAVLSDFDEIPGHWT